MILSWEDFTTHDYVSLFREDFTQELRPHVKPPGEILRGAHINDTLICNLGSF